MDEFQSITEALLPLLEGRLHYTKSVINLWFSDLEIVELTEDHVHFTTSTPLKEKILGTKYKKVIEDCLEEVIGFAVEASFTTRRDENTFLGPEEKPVEVPPSLIPVHNEQKKAEEEKINDYIRDSRVTILDSYTFDNFIEGASNKFARAACLAVAKEPNTYNPLFIWGQSGLGKTHLLYAVINYIKKNHPHLKIVYKKSEEFINELILAIEHGTTAQFKEKYRTADVLLIDDIQFIAGKESTQEEFFHTFTALYESEKQIILTSDRPPKEIKPLEDRLRTRFEGGLLADVQPPSFELRTAIIRKKADMMDLEISRELVEYMAERLQNNIRQIEGVLKKLRAVVSIEQLPVTQERIEEIISAIDPGNIPTGVLVERIFTVVSEEYGVSVEDIKSKKRTANIVAARHVAIYIMREITNLSLMAIGKIIDRDHATVLSSISNVDTNIRTVKNEQEKIEGLIKKIKG